MTVRKNDDGEFKIASWGMGTRSFRAAVFVLLLSMHPMGRQLLGTFGFQFPDEKKVAVAVEQSTVANQQIADMAKDLNKLKDDVRDLSTKVGKLDTSFTGFQIDFEKLRRVPPPAEK